jgi:hypothetical protein
MSGRAKQCASQKPTTARLRDMSSPEWTGFAASREAIPKVASRPKGASAASEASKVDPPTISRTTSTLRPPLACSSALRSATPASTVTSAPSEAGQLALLRRGGDADHRRRT